MKLVSVECDSLKSVTIKLSVEELKTIVYTLGNSTGEFNSYGIYCSLSKVLEDNGVSPYPDEEES